MEQLVELFKALSDETRVKILVILTHRKICAKSIANHLGISEAAVSQHLKILREARLIIGEKVGYYILYHVQIEPLDELQYFLDSLKGYTQEVNHVIEQILPKECSGICLKTKQNCCRKRNKREDE